MLLLLLALAPVTHQGFFLRADVDAGYGASTPGDARFSGPSGAVNLAIGLGVADNAALFVSLFDVGMSNPSVYVGQVKTTLNGSASLGAFGIGFTWYVMPANVFLSATVGAGQAMLEQGGQTHQSRFGPALRLGIGKEWPVSQGWGLGVAAYFTYANNATQEYPQTTWNTLSSMVGFSATFY